MTYKSKIKLYCNNCNFMVKKFGEYRKDSYICKVIEIKEKV